MISVDGLTVEFGDRALFKDISFVINDKDRIALMGKNGAFTHRQLSCGAKDALVFEIENRRVFLRCPGNQLEGITLLA